MADLESALAHLLKAKRISAPSQSYKKDNPAEYAKVYSYLTGGVRPTGIGTEMGLGLIEVEDVRRGIMPPPPPPPPTGVKLRWSPPPVDTAADKRWPVEHRTTAIGEVKGYRNVVAIAGDIIGGSTNSQGHIVPRENTGTFHWEGWRLALTTNADAFTSRWRTPIIQIQNCWIEVTKAGTDMHSDGFQTQESEVDELRFDRCTVKTDYQGIFTSNEPNSRPGGRSKVGKTILSRVLFIPGAQGYPATFYFKAFPPRPGTDPIGPCEFYDVWMPALNAVNKVYPNGYNWSAWDGTANRFGCFLEQKQHANGTTYPFLRFSKPSDTVPTGGAKGQACGDCQIGGDGGIWLYPDGGAPPAGLNVGCASDAGIGYVSPGYV